MITARDTAERPTMVRRKYGETQSQGQRWSSWHKLFQWPEWAQARLGLKNGRRLFSREEGWGVSQRAKQVREFLDSCTRLSSLGFFQIFN